VLQPPGYNSENYSQLTDKMFGTYKYIYKKYSNYDWYLKADDDTFIFMDNLKKFLRSKNSSIPINFGRNWNIIVESGYESGGAGYVLSREAMMRLGEALDRNNTFCSNTGVEDVDTASCLRKLNVSSGSKIYPNTDQLFNAYNFKRDIVNKKNIISFHYCSPLDIYKLNYLSEYFKLFNQTTNVKLIIDMISSPSEVFG
jgi:hypothetical protein